MLLSEKVLLSELLSNSMKIIHINCVYPYGSTGKITSELHRALSKDGHDSLVIYGRGKRRKEKNTYQVSNEFCGKLNHLFTRFTGMMYGGCFFETRKLIRILKQEEPDIVHIQCINGYFVNIYKLIEYLKKTKTKTVITLHAEFMYTANCGCTFGCEKWKNGCGDCPKLYQATESYLLDRTSRSFLRMQRAFSGFEKDVKVIGVSEWLSKRAARSPIMENLDIRTIYNGIDTRSFLVRDGRRMREELNIAEEEKLVLWVTSVFTNEKGKEAFENLVEMSSGKNWRFVVVGTKHAYMDKKNVIFYGKVADPKILAALYSAADVTISLSRQESFPTVFVEAQCCGTPVVGFNVGGVKESIRTGMGEAVQLGDFEGFMKAIETWSAEKRNIPAETVEETRLFFAADRMIREYRKVYEN